MIRNIIEEINDFDILVCTELNVTTKETEEQFICVVFRDGKGNLWSALSIAADAPDFITMPCMLFSKDGRDCTLDSMDYPVIHTYRKATFWERMAVNLLLYQYEGLVRKKLASQEKTWCSGGYPDFDEIREKICEGSQEIVAPYTDEHIMEEKMHANRKDYK